MLTANTGNEVSTAIPAFIGYTEKAFNNNAPLWNNPWKIESLDEYQRYFGGAPAPLFAIADDEESEYTLKRVDPFTLYYHIVLFFTNGGKVCYIVSVGDYTVSKPDRELLENGIKLLEGQSEPSLLVIPEAVYLTETDCHSLQQAMLTHCATQRNRFAILDIFNGYLKRDGLAGDVISSFRNGIGSENLSFGAAYYPWLNTSAIPENELSFRNVQDQANLSSIDYFKQKYYEELALEDASQIVPMQAELNGSDDNEVHIHLILSSPFYVEVLNEMLLLLNVLPPSAAIAGVYASVDRARSVWRAPANVSIAACTSPTVTIKNEDQEVFNSPADGKAVNAIRTFSNEGVKIWGARTLDGNSPEWKFVPIRRTAIMFEQSIRNLVAAFANESDRTDSWRELKEQIDSFLLRMWKSGCLMGSTTYEAFNTVIELESTVTPGGIHQESLHVCVFVALNRQSEFVKIDISQPFNKRKNV